MKRMYTKIEWLERIVGSIEKVGKDEPFLGIWLISDVIEFIGSCMTPSSIRGKRHQFEFAIKNLNAFKDCRNFKKLYENLRCGLTHDMYPSGSIKLKRTGENNSEYNEISYSQLLADLQSSLSEIKRLMGSNPQLKSTMETIYAEVEGDETSENPLTGSTESINITFQS